MTLYNSYLNNDAFICSYIGTIGMAHDIDVILRAAKYLKQEPAGANIQFLIVGDGACKVALERHTKDAELSNIHFMGLVQKEKIPAIIAASSASLIHLKKSKLFTTVIPSKLFELMAMNVPVIMGVEGESRNIVLEARAGEIMEPENECDLLKAIKTIRKNGRSYYHGRGYIEKYFNRDTLAENMLNIILSAEQHSCKHAKKRFA
jgi:glycosyltransferase involved in cell wall biosynthesis